MAVNYGSKRIVVGAHYGLRDWLAQRVTAVLMALFTALVLAQLLLFKGSIGYVKWASIFSAQWMKVITFTVILALLYHAWVGVRCASVNRLPKVGPLDAQRLAGLHILSALGSRGLTTALLCAQWLADQLEGKPPAGSEALYKAMQCDLENA